MYVKESSPDRSLFFFFDLERWWCFNATVATGSRLDAPRWSKKRTEANKIIVKIIKGKEKE